MTILNGKYYHKKVDTTKLTLPYCVFCNKEKRDVRTTATGHKICNSCRRENPNIELYLGASS